MTAQELLRRLVEAGQVTLNEHGEPAETRFARCNYCGHHLGTGGKLYHDICLSVARGDAQVYRELAVALDPLDEIRKAAEKGERLNLEDVRELTDKDPLFMVKLSKLRRGLSPESIRGLWWEGADAADWYEDIRRAAG